MLVLTIHVMMSCFSLWQFSFNDLMRIKLMSYFSPWQFSFNDLARTKCK